jgi:hypothetical protein
MSGSTSVAAPITATRTGTMAITTIVGIGIDTAIIATGDGITIRLAQREKEWPTALISPRRR